VTRDAYKKLGKVWCDDCLDRRLVPVNELVLSMKDGTPIPKSALQALVPIFLCDKKRRYRNEDIARLEKSFEE
ncbi:hypothetical protein HDU89_008281, partial [Geranomyces variabilis]